MRRLVLGLAVGLILVGGCSEGDVGKHGQTTPPPIVSVRPFRLADPNVVLLVSGGTNGLLEVCNCSGPMPGGLSRRGGLVYSYRAAFPHVFLLDLGDVFWVDPADLRNEYVLKGYARMGYDAVVLGDQEWAAGSKRLRDVLTPTGLTFLSSTVDCPGVKLARVVKREWGEVKLAVVSDMRQDAFRFLPKAAKDPLVVAPPAELVEEVRKLKQAGYVVVLVAHAEAEAIEAAAARTEADLVLRGHTTRSESKVTRVAGKNVLKIGGSAKMGAVALKVVDGKIAEMDFRVEEIDRSWPMDRRLLSVYEAYAHAALRKALDADRTSGLEYLPSAKCGSCHETQLASWRKTRHAHAYATLQKAERTGDPNCLMCHTSGFGTVKGFYSYDKTPGLANVNCQDCHRFNKAEHQKKGFEFPRVTLTICVTCHTPVTDPSFRYGARRPKIKCPRTPVAAAKGTH